MRKSKKIILSGLLLSLYIILARFISFKSQILVISFSFIPIIISAIILGPKYSMLIAGLGDFLGATLFPFGSYFIGFTIIEAFIGLIYGIFLYAPKNDNENESNTLFYKNKQFIIRLIFSSFINLIIIGIFITGLMISKLYGNAYVVVISSRAITKIIMLPIQIIIMTLLNKTIIKYTEKYLLD